MIGLFQQDNGQSHRAALSRISSGAFWRILANGLASIIPQHELERAFMGHGEDSYSHLNSAVGNIRELTAWLSISPEVFRAHVEFMPYQFIALCMLQGPKTLLTGIVFCMRGISSLIVSSVLKHTDLLLVLVQL